MQTFITDPDPEIIASTLDYRRLNKQRVECKQIYLAIIDPDYGWQHHPAVNMWRRNRQALAHYAVTMCYEWLSRGYNDHVNLYHWFLLRNPRYDSYPHWWGDTSIIESHRANLVRKDPEFYGAIWPDLEPRDTYIWPE